MNKLKVTNSNLPGGESVIRIYLDKSIIVEEPITKRNPLNYLNTLTRSKHFTSIERQLMKHGLTLSDVGIKRASAARKQGESVDPVKGFDEFCKNKEYV